MPLPPPLSLPPRVRPHLLTIAPLLAALLSAVCLVLLSSGTARAALPDPTRPPPGLGGDTIAPSTARAAPVSVLAPTTTADPSASQRASRQPPPVAITIPRVQALHLPADRSAPPSALIDGRLVRVGDRLGDATVEDIRADGVRMRLARGSSQWLGLFTLVEAPAPDARQP